MNFLDTYRFFATPLSPIHLGTGESYSPTNYVISDDLLYEFDTGTVFGTLTEPERQELQRICSARPNEDMILALQRYFHERRETLAAGAVNHVPVLPGVAALYAKRVGQTANQEVGGGKVLNRLEIDRSSFDPITRLPVLLGSALKGAIRTALLDQANHGKPLRRSNNTNKDENNQELQRRLFQYQAGKFELDPMRLVHLSDAAWRGAPDLPATQVQLAVNRKKQLVRDAQGGLRKSQADKLYQILECVAPWHYRAFAGQLNLHIVREVKEAARNTERQLPVAGLRFSAVQIAQACNAFYAPILRAERTLLSERGYADPAWSASLDKLLAASREKMARGEVCLVRVGRHAGAESITLNGVRRIEIMLDKDQHTPKRNSTTEASARTIWLAANDTDQSTNLRPFGWMMIELQPLSAAIADANELKEACAPYASGLRLITAKIGEQRSRFAQAHAAALALHQAEAETKRLERLAQEQAERQAKERHNRLTQMPPNLRRIEEFKTEFASRARQLNGGLDRPNTKFHDLARALAKAALEEPGWSAAEKGAAADAIAAWLPKVVSGMDKDALKKLRLATLRGAA